MWVGPLRATALLAPIAAAVPFAKVCSAPSSGRAAVVFAAAVLRAIVRRAQSLFAAATSRAYTPLPRGTACALRPFNILAPQALR